MGLFNNISKLTQKVISKFKNTGNLPQSLTVPITNNAHKEDMVNGAGGFRHRKAHKGKGFISNRKKRAQVNPMIKYNFGNFSPCKSI